MKLTAKERAAFRDHVALQVTSICMGDLSRQISEGKVPLADIPLAADRIAELAYEMAEALVFVRDHPEYRKARK